MMKKLFFILIIIVCLLRITLITFEKSTYYEDEKSITGFVTNIKEEKDKITFDLKDNNNKYRVTLKDKCEFSLGDKVLVNGKVYTPYNNTIFNLFNYRKYLLSKGIEYAIKPSYVKVIKENENFFYNVKNQIIRRIDNYKSKAYLKTFVLADTSLLDEKTKENYQLMGVSHLLAVSGMHVSIILLVLNFVLKKFKLKNIIIFLFLLFFLFLTNYPESLMRTVLFLTLKYFNKKFSVNYKHENVLVITGCFLLLLNPYLIYSVGFLFSFTISYFIILVSKKIKGNNYLVRLFMISLISFLASVPIMAHAFFKVNLLSTIFNVIMVPIFSFLIFPLGILTFFIHFLDEIFFCFIEILESIVNFLSSFDFFIIILSKPNFIFIFLYYFSLYTFIKVRKEYILIFIITFLLNVNSRFFINEPEVVFLDVGQGDSIIFIYPHGKTIMIDTGGSYNDDYSIGKEKIIPYLNSLGISKIEYLILTHGDADHMKEAVTLVNDFKVENVVFNNDDFNDLELNLIRVLNEKEISYHQDVKELNVGNDKLYFLNDMIYDNENDNSNVIYTELNGFKFLFMGDVGTKVEEYLLENYNLENIDVLKVGHHGSKTSSSKEFIDVVNPRYSVISVGKNNVYGHPNDSVLDNLEESKIYRTDLDGSVEIKLTKNGYKIRTCGPYE